MANRNIYRYTQLALAESLIESRGNALTGQKISIDYFLARKVPNRPTVLPQENIWNIINAPDNLKYRLILMTTYSAGLRASEVIALKPEHIESKRMLINIQSVITIKLIDSKLYIG